ncbi:MAG: FecR domain-containing protein [Ekhidna sp.]|nr:FecR domain-containing protein [Ekhidna sp.]
MDDLEKYRKILDHDSEESNDELADFLLKSSKAKIPEGRGKDAIWDAIDSTIEDSQERAKPKHWTYLGIAASVTLLISLIFVFRTENTPAEVRSEATLMGETKVIDLPDGSQVSLNANSRVTFSTPWNREVLLKGEGFFEVVKGGKFTVQTTIGSVEVLGTSFNVYARDSAFAVACKTGKVKVAIPGKSILEPLTPGQSIRLEMDTVKRSSLDTDLVGKWQAGEFYFSEQRLSNVLKEVERQFGVSIYLPDTTEYIFDGYFTNKNVESALEMVCLPLGLEYEKTGSASYSIKELE